MAQERGRILTGARAKLQIEGVKVGYATDVRIREEIAYDEVEVLDNIEIEEHVPTRYRVTLSFGFMRVIGETLKTLGYFPQTGIGPEQHLQNILVGGELTVSMEAARGGAAGTTIYIVEGVRISSQDVSITARGIVGTSVDAVALRLLDDAEA